MTLKPAGLGSNDTAEVIVEKLSTLVGNERLDASKVKNIPAGTGGGLSADDVDNKIAAEAQIRATKDTSLDTELSSVQTTLVTTTQAITTEEANRTTADTVLSQTISTNADAAAAAVASETTSRENADTVVQANIDVVTTAVETEAASREAADETLTQNLASEQTARTAGDETLTQSVADAIDVANAALIAEQTARRTADNTLTENLSTEIANRTTADTALDQRITAAGVAADLAHQTLQANIDAIEGLTVQEVDDRVDMEVESFAQTDSPSATVPTDRLGDGSITADKLAPGVIPEPSVPSGGTGLTQAQLDAIAANTAKISFNQDASNKLADIEANATTDQTSDEIKSLYEANDDTNAFTDADQTKLEGISIGAQVNVLSDWDAPAGATSEILNKPEIPSSGGGGLTETQIQALIQVWALANNFTLIPPSKLPNASATERGVVLISTQDLFDSGADAVTIDDTNYTVAPRMSLLKAALDSKIGKTVHALLNTPGLVAAGADAVITAGTNSITIDDVNLSLYVKPSQMKAALELLQLKLIAGVGITIAADGTISATGGGGGGAVSIPQMVLDAIAANTAKIGITPDQAAAIVLNTAKTAGGDVFGPAASTDNALVIFNGTTGKTIINSLATIDDDGGYHSAINGSGSKKAFELLQANLGFENQLQFTLGIASAQHQQFEINFRRGNIAANNATSLGVWGAAMWFYPNGRVSIGPQLDASQVERFLVNGTTKLDGNTEVVGNIVLSGLVDGRDVAADGIVLDTLEAGGTSYVLPDATEIVRGGALRADDRNISTGTDIRLVGTLASTVFVLPSQLKSEVEKYQLKLVAGTNISITDEGVISASGLDGGSAPSLTGLAEERPGGNANFVYQKVIPATNGQVDITPGDTYPLGHGSRGYAIQYTDSRSNLRLTASGTLGHPIPGLYGFFISGGHILECYLNPTFLPNRNQTKIQARFTEVRKNGTEGRRTIVFTKSQGQSTNDIASFFTNIIANFNLSAFSYFKNVQIWYDPNAVNGANYIRALFPATVSSESTKVSDLSDLRSALGVQNSGESLKHLTEATPDNRSEFVFHESIAAHDAGFSFTVGLNPIGNNSVGYGRESSGTINRRDAFLTYNAGSVSLDIPFLLGIGYDGDTGKIEVVTTADIDHTSIKLRIKFPGRVQQELILFKKGTVAGITRNSIRYSTPDGGATYRLWKIGETYSDVNILYDTDDAELVTTQLAKEVTKSSSLEHLNDALSEGNITVVDSIDNITPDHTKFYTARDDNRTYRFEYDHGDRVALHAGVVKTGAFGVSVGATNIRNIAYTKGGTLGVTTTGTGGGSKFIAIYSGVPGQSTTLPVSSVVRVKHDTAILGEIIVNGVEHRLFRITHDADPAVAGFNSWTADLYDEYTTYGDPLALKIRSLDRDIGIKYADGTTFFSNDESTSLVAFDVNDTDGKSVFTQQDRIHLSGLGRGVLPYEIQALADNLTITANTTSILDMIPKQISPASGLSTVGFRQNLGYETKEPSNFYTEAGAKIFGKHVVTIQTNRLGVLEIETLGLKLSKVSIGVPGAANVEFILRKDRLNRKNSFLHVNTNVYTAESYNIPFVVDSLVKVGLIDENGRAVVFDSTGAASIILDSNIKAQYDSLTGAPGRFDSEPIALLATHTFTEAHGLTQAPAFSWATISPRANFTLDGQLYSTDDNWVLTDESAGPDRGYNVRHSLTEVKFSVGASFFLRDNQGNREGMSGDNLARFDVQLHARV